MTGVFTLPQTSVILKRSLGARHVTFYLLREDQAALSNWVNELRESGGGPFAQIATDEFAKHITRTMQRNVQVVQ